MKEISSYKKSKMKIAFYGYLFLGVFVFSACRPNVVITTEFPTIAPTPSVMDPSLLPAPANPGPVDIGVGYVERWGMVLVDGNGMTLYISTFDPPDRSYCDANCLELWQPLLAKDNLELGEGVYPSLLGTGTLPDGSKVVTYGHWPLYRFALDATPGDNQGQGYYDSWFMISPEGEVLESREG